MRAQYIGKKVICIDDDARPNEIPKSKWPKHGEVYTIKDIEYSLVSKVRLLILEEIDLSDCAPYGGFSIKRFRLV